MLSTPPSPASELGWGRGHASRRSRQLNQQAGRQSLKSENQSEQRLLGDGLGYYRNASIPRGADQVWEIDVPPKRKSSRSRGRYQNPDPRSLKTEWSSMGANSDYGSMVDSTPRKRARVSSRRVQDIEHGEPQLPWHARDEYLSALSVAHAGSWCNSALRDSFETQPGFIDVEDDILADDWRPMTPRESRLSTPDLAPLCTHYEFCKCCSNEDEDKINEEWYLASKAKMDSQMIDALGYIAQANAAR
ncbi:hypothetical protein ACJZ2D_007442 [Fusarium nematophilum]